MARLPDATALGERVIASARKPIVEDNSHEILREGAMEVSANIFGGIERLVDAHKDREAAQAAKDSAEGMSTLRNVSEQKFIDAQGEAADDGAGFADGVLANFDKDLKGATAGKPPKSANAIEQQGLAYRAQLSERATRFETDTRYRHTVQTFEDSIDRTSVAATLDPSSAPRASLEQSIAIDHSGLPPQQRASLKEKLKKVALAGVLGVARRDPQSVFNMLKSPDTLPDMPLADRAHVEQFAKTELVQQRTAAIMSAYNQSTSAGTTALTALGNSGLDADLLEDIRSHVGQGVSQLRVQRRQERVADLVAVDRAIATDTTGPGTETLVNRLYSTGALSPDEYSNTLAAIDSSTVRRAKAGAGAAEIANALAAGLPLDPKDADQRKALDSYFVSGTNGVERGSEPWQSAAMTVANKTRMLPDSALAWTRQAMRSPDASIAGSAAQFYGAVATAAPDALSGFDDDTKAFAGTVNSMIEAGTDPKKAVEVARANVFELKSELREQRRKQYTKEVTNSPAALAVFIDQDFDPGMFSSQPGATAALQTDFDSQAQRYFERVGDISLARKLAWSDLTRVYGETRVNGSPMVSAFPVERFGVKPEEVRADISTFMSANPQADGSTADDILLVPDALTLRQAGDALSGQAVRPSYTLMTKSGDVVLDNHGVRKRYTIPSGEALAERIRAAQTAAEARAREQVDAARKRREAVRQLKDAALLGGAQ